MNYYLSVILKFFVFIFPCFIFLKEIISILKKLFLNKTIVYKIADWAGWSACSASCQISLTNPVRFRTRDYCLNNDLSTYQCRDEDMINYEPCNTDSCFIGC